MIPSIEYQDECDYTNTKLCYSKENMNSKCKYPTTYYDCLSCTSNANVINDVCKCNDGYLGVGYMECSKNDCPYINSLLGKDELYDCCKESGITCSPDGITKM